MIFLVEDMYDYLASLQKDLNEYAHKHAWERRAEGLTKGEANSWLNALRFFGGSESLKRGLRGKVFLDSGQ